MLVVPRQIFSFCQLDCDTGDWSSLQSREKKTNTKRKRKKEIENHSGPVLEINQTRSDDPGDYNERAFQIPTATAAGLAANETSISDFLLLNSPHHLAFLVVVILIFLHDLVLREIQISKLLRRIFYPPNSLQSGRGLLHTSAWTRSSRERRVGPSYLTISWLRIVSTI